jgi:hypothetical protein
MWGKMQLHHFWWSSPDSILATIYRLCEWTNRFDPDCVQRIREDMTLRFRKLEVGSWQLEVGFIELCSRISLPYLGSSVNFHLPTSNFLISENEGHAKSSRIRCTNK